MPVPAPLGPHYTKSLRLLLNGPMGIHERKDVVRYKALQAMGLVDGVGVRCVSLTKTGREVLRTGTVIPQSPIPVENADYDITLNGRRATVRPTPQPSYEEFPF